MIVNFYRLVQAKLPLLLVAILPLGGYACSTLQPDSSSQGDAASEVVLATSSLVAVEGRSFAGSRDGSISIAYPGTALHFSATAKKVFLRAHSSGNEQYLDVLKDGERVQKVRLYSGMQEILLWESSKSDKGVNPMDFEVIRASAPWQGTLELISVRVEGGSFVQTAALPMRKLLFIGDSITSGSVSDPETPDQGKSLSNNNGRFSYGRLTSRLLQAQAHLVSYGGRGLIRDWEGKDNSMTNNAPVFYPRAHPDDPSKLWDHSRYQADGIVVNLGTNDLNSGVPDFETFVTAYTDFVQQIRSDYPQAHIFLMLSPMHSVNSSQRKALSEFISATIERLDDSQVSMLDVSYYPGRRVDPHPVKEEHAAMANEIAPIIAETLGWD